jgi:hypothetical protein
MNQLREVEHVHEATIAALESLSRIDSMAFVVESATVRVDSHENGVYDVKVMRDGRLSVQPQRHPARNPGQ